MSTSLYLPSALMRKVLCLSLCSLPEGDIGLGDAERSILQAASPSRRVRKKSFVRPSAKAILTASALLVRFASNFPMQANDRRKQVDAWRQSYLNRENFSNTPLTMWADAIPARFDSIWDLLAFEPNGELDLEQPWPAPGVEFWMYRPSISRLDSSPYKSITQYSKTNSQHTLSEGVWRTLAAITSICTDEQIQDRLFGLLRSEDDWNTILKILYSFALPVYSENEQRDTRIYPGEFIESEKQQRAYTSANLLLSVGILSNFSCSTTQSETPLNKLPSNMLCSNS